jgi:hypothetical protein
VNHDSQQPYARTLLSGDIRLIYAQLPDILPLDRPAITQGITLLDRLEQPTHHLRHLAQTGYRTATSHHGH